MSKRWWMAVWAVLAAVALVASACGDDDGDGTDAGEPAAEPGDGGEGMTSLDVMVADGALDGVPDEIPAGVVEVNFDAGGAEDASLDFSKVSGDMSEQDFREGLSVLLTGGPFDDRFENNAGALPGTTTLVLEPGEYYVWAEPQSDDAPEPEAEAPEEGAADEGGESGEGEGGEEEGPPPDSFIVQPLTVTGEAGDGELDTDNAGEIVAVDYAFEVDVEAGDGFDFVNDGAEQFHHAVVFDFGSSDPEALEPFVLPFLESEGEIEAPDGVEIPEGDPEAAFSGVYGPGSKGTGAGTFRAGHTYVVTCFISDRAGGPPHAFAENMYEVFTVDG